MNGLVNKQVNWIHRDIKFTNTLVVRHTGIKLTVIELEKVTDK